MSFAIPEVERELVKNCLDLDRAAQRKLFLQYKDAMYTILLRMLNDQEEATDALQETFIAVFKSLKSFQFHSTLGAWIKTITIRTGLAHQRKFMQRTMVDESELPETIVWPDNMTGESLELAMAKLSQGYRNVFMLIEVEGYAHKEVAEMLGISEGTSKSQLYHAKKTLQKILQGYQYTQ